VFISIDEKLNNPAGCSGSDKKILEGLVYSVLENHVLWAWSEVDGSAGKITGK